MIKIREANEEDNDVLIELGRKCPMGTNLVLGADSSPDYFARSKPFADWHVLVAIENGRIVGSAGCAIRDTRVGGRLCKTAYEYGFMVDPQHRRKGTAAKLQKHIEHLALQENVDLLHLLVTEGNVPSMNLFSKMGFKLIKDCATFSLMVYKKQKLVGEAAIRSMEKTDTEKIASMINEVYHGYNFFHSLQTEDFVEYVKRIPYFNLHNILVFEKGEDIKACLGYWDYNKVMKFIVQRFNWKMKAISFMMRIMGLFTNMPVIPKLGEPLMAYNLTTLAYKDTESLGELIRFITNIALENKIKFLYIPVDLESPIVVPLSRFRHITVKTHFFIKSLKQKEFPRLREGKLYIDIVDI